MYPLGKICMTDDKIGAIQIFEDMYYCLEISSSMLAGKKCKLFLSTGWKSMFVLSQLNKRMNKYCIFCLQIILPYVTSIKY